MNFTSTLLEGRILKRYKRFFADIELPDGKTVVAHVANTGSMKTCWEPGWPVLISDHTGSERKLLYTLEMTHNGRSWIGVNTNWPNKIAREAIEDKNIPEFSSYDVVIPEQKIGTSRIDLLLQDSKAKLPDTYVEVKNVTMQAPDGTAIFPDAVSERGQKHLRELISLKKKGLGAGMLFIVQREDVKKFRAAVEIDPTYAKLLKEAFDTGVIIVAYQCTMSKKGISVKKSLPIDWD